MVFGVTEREVLILGEEEGEEEEEEEEEGEKGCGRKIDKEEKGRYLMGGKKCVDEKKERIKKKKKKEEKKREVWVGYVSYHVRKFIKINSTTVLDHNKLSQNFHKIEMSTIHTLKEN